MGHAMDAIGHAAGTLYQPVPEGKCRSGHMGANLPVGEVANEAVGVMDFTYRMPKPFHAFWASV